MSPPKRLGDYLIRREIGRGGMGVVFEADHMLLSRRVALKVMAPYLTQRPAAIERFRREAELAARLDHPGICRIHDAGLHQGQAWIAMAFIEGETLADRLRRRSQSESRALTLPIDAAAVRADQSTQPAPDALTPVSHPSEPSTDPYDSMTVSPAGEDERTALLTLVSKVAAALQAAHDKGVLHRDLKPGNIMITDDERPVILDFGLARDESDSGPTLTQTGDVLGTPAYMAPEQTRGEPLDRRADIWALGVILYEGLTGVLPFRGATRLELFRSIVEDEPTPLRRLLPRCPRDLESVVAAALEKEPGRRYETAADFAADILRVMTGEPIRARRPGRFERAWHWSRRHPAESALLLAFLVLIAAGASFLTYFVSTRDEIAASRQEKAWLRREARLAEGLLLAGFDEGEKAESVLTELVEEAPSAEAVAALALARLDRRDGQGALSLLDRFAAFEPETPSLTMLRWGALRRLGQEPDPEVLARGLPEPRSSIDYFIRALVTLNRHIQGEAVDEAALRSDIEEAMARSARSRQALQVLRVRALGELKDREGLARAAASLADGWPDSAATWFSIGLASKAAGDWMASTEAFRRSTELAPDDHQAFEQLAESAARSGDRAQAFAAVERAESLAPNTSLPHLARGLVEEAFGAPEKALAAYERALTRPPSLVGPRRNLARLLSRGIGAPPDTARAASLLESVLQEHPEDADSRYALAVIRFESGDPKAAREQFAGCVAARPEHAEFHHALAQALSALDEDEEALAEAREARRLAPKEPGYAYTVGVFLWTAGRNDEALKQFQASVALDGSNAQARALMGRLLFLTGQADEAVAALTEALESFAGDSGRGREIEAWLDEARDEQKTVQAADAILAASSDDREALLGYARHFAGRDGRRAFALFDRAFAAGGAKEPPRPDRDRRLAIRSALDCGPACLGPALDRLQAELAALEAAPKDAVDEGLSHELLAIAEHPTVQALSSLTLPAAEAEGWRRARATLERWID